MNASNKEIDFIIQQKNSKIEAKIQVCIDLHAENYKREVSSFIIADKYIKDSRNILLTFGESNKYNEGETLIEEHNILEWLLF